MFYTFAFSQTNVGAPKTTFADILNQIGDVYCKQGSPGVHDKIIKQKIFETVYKSKDSVRITKSISQGGS